mmetsp:Transcript_34035/g.85680  ORF Transcript_34035/g.85680 Transcript_34035/m.85680 type:complete len:200 (+) Transcript_34035:130-729(+)
MPIPATGASISTSPPEAPASPSCNALICASSSLISSRYFFCPRSDASRTCTSGGTVASASAIIPAPASDATAPAVASAAAATFFATITGASAGLAWSVASVMAFVAPVASAALDVSSPAASASIRACSCASSPRMPRTLADSALGLNVSSAATTSSNCANVGGASASRPVNRGTSKASTEEVDATAGRTSTPSTSNKTR